MLFLHVCDLVLYLSSSRKWCHSFGITSGDGVRIIWNILFTDIDTHTHTQVGVQAWGLGGSRSFSYLDTSFIVSRWPPVSGENRNITAPNHPASYGNANANANHQDLSSSWGPTVTSDL